MGQRAARSSQYKAPAELGWLARWNPVTLTDGRYTAISLAYDAAGHRTQSKTVVLK